MQYQLVTLLAILTTNTYAMCYSVYDSDNVLIYESTTSPVPLNSPSLHGAVNKRFPGSAMMIDHRACPHFELKQSQKTAIKVPIEKSLWRQSPSSESRQSDIERIVVVPNAEEKVIEASKAPSAIAPVLGVQQSSGSPPQAQQQTQAPQAQTQVLVIQQPQLQVEIIPVQTQTTIIGLPIQQNQTQSKQQQDIAQRQQRVQQQQDIAQSQQRVQQQQDIAQSQQRVQESIQKQAAMSQARRESCLAQLPSQISNSVAIKNAGTSGASMAALLAQRQAAALAACNSIR